MREIEFRGFHIGDGTDIVRIIEGIRYRMPIDRIEKLLVKTKG